MKIGKRYAFLCDGKIVEVQRGYGGAWIWGLFESTWQALRDRHGVHVYGYSLTREAAHASGQKAARFYARANEVAA